LSDRAVRCVARERTWRSGRKAVERVPLEPVDRLSDSSTDRGNQRTHSVIAFGASFTHISRSTGELFVQIWRGFGEPVRKCYRFISLGGPDLVPPLLENSE